MSSVSEGKAIDYKNLIEISTKCNEKPKNSNVKKIRKKKVKIILKKKAVTDSQHQSTNYSKPTSKKIESELDENDNVTIVKTGQNRKKKSLVRKKKQKVVKKQTTVAVRVKQSMNKPDGNTSNSAERDKLLNDKTETDSVSCSSKCTKRKRSVSSSSWSSFSSFSYSSSFSLFRGSSSYSDRSFVHTDYRSRGRSHSLTRGRSWCRRSYSRSSSSRYRSSRSGSRRRNISHSPRPCRRRSRSGRNGSSSRNRRHRRGSHSSRSFSRELRRYSRSSRSTSRSQTSFDSFSSVYSRHSRSRYRYDRDSECDGHPARLYYQNNFYNRSYNYWDQGPYFNSYYPYPCDRSYRYDDSRLSRSRSVRSWSSYSSFSDSGTEYCSSCDSPPPRRKRLSIKNRSREGSSKCNSTEVHAKEKHCGGINKSFQKKAKENTEQNSETDLDSIKSKSSEIDLHSKIESVDGINNSTLNSFFSKKIGARTDSVKTVKTKSQMKPNLQENHTEGNSELEFSDVIVIMDCNCHSTDDIDSIVRNVEQNNNTDNASKCHKSSNVSGVRACNSEPTPISAELSVVNHEHIGNVEIKNENQTISENLHLQTTSTSRRIVKVVNKSMLSLHSKSADDISSETCMFAQLQQSTNSKRAVFLSGTIEDKPQFAKRTIELKKCEKYSTGQLQLFIEIGQCLERIVKELNLLV